ncbi:cytochrome P450 [Karstenula rhodostoma CBS 690.94]|uniref:Cytochrome P450 n=1 Tax=Karstenula rhodostoma CBS 690.94 TaxID=1392251 RepID=A0A9P4PG41_9PLEO|nr:cytochrome P450 [Karstenula rhodostoma CBS 690.94]
MDLFKIFASATVLYSLYITSRLYRNYLRAKTTGFKLRIFPFEIGTPLFTVVASPFYSLITRFFPQSFARTYDLGVYGVEWRDRVAKRERETPGYIVVTPANALELFVEDGEMANAILARRREFEQDEVSRTIMNRFGEALAGSVGEGWSRQRRLIAPMLNERIMETVWSESQQQTHDMMSCFTNVEDGTTSGTVTGLRRIAFNILSTIGYGMPTEWSADVKQAGKGERMDFMEALLHLVDGLILLVVFPPWLLRQFWMPKSLRQIGEAYYQFYEHSSEMLQKERESLKSSGTIRNTFLSSLASVNDNELDPYEKEGRLNKPAFTEDQITGNLYTFTLAGYDTTANTMAYAVAMLAAYPQWQDWIIEEIDQIHKEVSDPNSYQQVLPKLERCLSLMFETLRMFTPVAHIVRECPVEKVLTSRGKTYRIPANTRCTLSLDGVGAHRDVWGDDVFEFRPSRWSVKAAKLTGSTSIAQVPKLEAAGAKESFLPWSSGPRACPGMKMAQTEFLSVIYTIFSEYRTEPALEAGESLEHGLSRVAAIVADSQPRLTLQMNRPNDLKLKWVRR